MALTTKNLSYKLLSIASDDTGTGNLKLYTEFDHVFETGDIVYLSVEAHENYNNVKDLQFTQSYNTPYNKYNPYHPTNMGYKIIEVNNNEIVLNYQFSDGIPNIPHPANHSPYADTALSNPQANPQDLIDLAYNNYSANNLYKGIYITKLMFVNGIVKKGEIHDGVFGSDLNTIYLNTYLTFQNYTVKENLKIDHIVAKNINLSKCIISSKTDLDILDVRNKYRVNEDTYSQSSIISSNNNSGWGYSVFEKIRTHNDTEINNGIFDNPLDNKIRLKTVVANKAKIGSKIFVNTNGNFIEGLTMKGGELNSITANASLPVDFITTDTINRGLVDSFIDLQATMVITSLANPGQLQFRVPYYLLANQFLGNIGGTYYLTGIESINTNFDNYTEFLLNKNLECVLDSVSYAYGILGSAQVTVTITNPDVISSWASIQPTLAFTKVWSNARLHQMDKTIEKGTYSFVDLKTVYDNTNHDIYIKNHEILTNNFSRIIYGKYKGVSFDYQTSFKGLSYGQNIYLEDSLQLINNVISSNQLVTNIFRYVLMYNNEVLEFNLMQYSKIIGGSIQNTRFKNFRADAIDVTYLQNCELDEFSYIESNVFWDNIKITDNIGDYVSGSLILNKGYLGDRKLLYKTARTTLESPLDGNDYAVNLNITKGLKGAPNAMPSAALKYNDITNFATNKSPNYKLYYEVPALDNIQDPLNALVPMVIIDHGNMQHLNPNVWTYLPNQKINILHSGIISGDLLTKITFRYNNSSSGSYTVFPGGVDDTFYILYKDQLTGDIDIIEDTDDFNLVWSEDNYTNLDTVRIDNRYVTFKNFYNYILPTDVRQTKDITVSLLETSSLVDNFPDPLLNNPLTFMNMKLIGTTTYSNITHNTLAFFNVNTDTYTLNLQFLNTLIDNLSNPATKICACFIEVEYVKIYNLTTNTPVLHKCTYVPPTGDNDEYTWENFKDPSTYINDFTIKDQTNTNITFTINPATQLRIEIDFWITWYYNLHDYGLSNTETNVTTNLTGREGGYRTKHTFVRKLQS